jgi:S-DNA-T family DNA segregation ATPase FtsK/SpoIIIE
MTDAGEPHDHESVYDDGTRALGKPVDPPDRPPMFADIVARTDNRRPIVPATLRSRDQRRTLYRWAVRLGLHTSAYHVTRTPKYGLKVAWYAPRGAWRLTWRVGRWALDGHTLLMEQEAVRRRDLDGFLKTVRSSRAPRRLLLVGLITSAGTCVAGLGYWLAPTYISAITVAFVVLTLARVGRPIGKPITDRVVVGEAFRKLTANMTRKALLATGTVKDPASVTFPVDIGRDGPGQTAIVDLPDGVIATDVIDKRDQLAGGFRLPKSQVWPSVMPDEHPGRLRIWVADRPVARMKQPAWPLLRQGTTDYFKPVPFGFDERLGLVDWTFPEKNSLFAGIPGSGKSLAVRVVVCAAVLDPLVVPVLFELKGTGDFDMFEPLCPDGLYGSGADRGTLQAAFDALGWLERECDRRGPLVKHWVAQGLNTENKVNRVMAEREPRLRPILAVFDEVQELFTDAEFKALAKARATSLIKRGRALGIHVVLATQRIDKESIPRGISSNMGVRFCMAVTAHTECDLVLGTGAYRRGARPTEFEPATGDDPKDSGWGWRTGLGPMAPARAAYLNNDAAKAIAARAIALRRGQDVPDVDRAPAYNLLDDVRAVWPAGDGALWSELIVEALAAYRPEVYGDWITVEDGQRTVNVSVFNAAMRSAGVEVKSVSRQVEGGRRATRYGVYLKALEAALGRREIE